MISTSEFSDLKDTHLEWEIQIQQLEPFRRPQKGARYPDGDVQERKALYLTDRNMVFVKFLLWGNKKKDV